MASDYQLDNVDKQLLNHLIKDARKSYVQIANEMHVSNSLVHQRIAKLKERGIIKGARLQVDPRLVGYSTCAFTGVQLEQAKFAPAVMERLKQVTEVVSCDNISGKYALLIKVYARDNEELRKVLYEKVHTIEGVSGTDTWISFANGFDRPFLPV